MECGVLVMSNDPRLWTVTILTCNRDRDESSKTKVGAKEKKHAPVHSPMNFSAAFGVPSKNSKTMRRPACRHSRCQKCLKKKRKGSVRPHHRVWIRMLTCWISFKANWAMTLLTVQSKVWAADKIVRRNSSFLLTLLTPRQWWTSVCLRSWSRFGFWVLSHSQSEFSTNWGRERRKKNKEKFVGFRSSFAEISSVFFPLFICDFHVFHCSWFSFRLILSRDCLCVCVFSHFGFIFHCFYWISSLFDLSLLAMVVRSFGALALSSVIWFVSVDWLKPSSKSVDHKSNGSWFA